MSTDWREKEREFLSSLAADTGRDLSAWMALIAAQGFKDKNEVIDWLRAQGFLFARASWLERIHNNGGRPIYITPEDLAAPPPAAVAAAAQPEAVKPEAVKPEPAKPETMNETATSPAMAQPVAEAAVDVRAVRVQKTAPPPSPAEAVAEVLARAKAYRPLAQHLLRALENSVPGLIVSAGAAHLMLATDRPFALLAVSGKDVRLALAMPGRAVEPPLEPLKLPVTLARPAEGMTHMIVLTDARQIDARLLGIVRTAATAAA